MLADGSWNIAIINSKDFSINDLNKQIRYFLSQFFNFIKDEISLIGSRPFSLDEETIICSSLDTISIVRP